MILLILILILFLIFCFNYENFKCASTFVEMIGIKEPVINNTTETTTKTAKTITKRAKTTTKTAIKAITPITSNEPITVKKCCPKDKGFSVVIYGNRPADSVCCQNHKKLSPGENIYDSKYAQYNNEVKKHGILCTTTTP